MWARVSLLALVVAMIGALAVSGTAGARRDCGGAVLADWFDNGRVDRLYDLRCYGEAIDAIPLDIRDYSDAEEVISRALQAATHGRLARGGVDPTLRDEPVHQRSDAGITSAPSSGSDRAATAAVDASGVSSLPIPLLVLGELSLALLGAGGFGRVRRRRVGTEDSKDDRASRP